MDKAPVLHDNMNVHIWPEQNADYMSDIQAYRTIAVIAVVLYHAGRLLPGGFLGSVMHDPNSIDTRSCYLN